MGSSRYLISLKPIPWPSQSTVDAGPSCQDFVFAEACRLQYHTRSDLLGRTACRLPPSLLSPSAEKLPAVHSRPPSHFRGTRVNKLFFVFIKGKARTYVCVCAAVCVTAACVQKPVNGQSVEGIRRPLFPPPTPPTAFCTHPCSQGYVRSCVRRMTGLYLFMLGLLCCIPHL